MCSHVFCAMCRVSSSTHICCCVHHSCFRPLFGVSRASELCDASPDGESLTLLACLADVFGLQSDITALTAWLTLTVPVPTEVQGHAVRYLSAVLLSPNPVILPRPVPTPVPESPHVDAVSSGVAATPSVKSSSSSAAAVVVPAADLNNSPSAMVAAVTWMPSLRAALLHSATMGSRCRKRPLSLQLEHPRSLEPSMLSVFAVAVSLSTDPWAHVRPNSDLTVFASIDDSEEDASQKDALASISTGDVVPPLPSKRNRTVRMPLQSIRDNDSEESDKEDGDVSEEDAVDLLRQSGRQCTVRKVAPTAPRRTLASRADLVSAENAISWAPTLTPATDCEVASLVSVLPLPRNHPPALPLDFVGWQVRPVQILQTQMGDATMLLRFVCPAYNIVSFELGDDHNQTIVTMSAFQACRENALVGPSVTDVTGEHNILLHVGGPVAALDWCPASASASASVPASASASASVSVSAPSAATFLAVSAHIDGKYHVNSTRKHHANMIQLWSVFEPSSLVRSTSLASVSVPPAARFCLGILHSGGVALSLSWCPCSASDTRLGLLAACLADGSVNIYAVPHPAMSNTPLLLALSPVFRYEAPDFSAMTLSWSVVGQADQNSGHALFSTAFSVRLAVGSMEGTLGVSCAVM